MRLPLPSEARQLDPSGRQATDRRRFAPDLRARHDFERVTFAFGGPRPHVADYGSAALIENGAPLWDNATQNALLFEFLRNYWLVADKRTMAFQYLCSGVKIELVQPFPPFFTPMPEGDSASPTGVGKSGSAPVTRTPDSPPHRGTWHPRSCLARPAIREV
jgi:hypothetical protein